MLRHQGAAGLKPITQPYWNLGCDPRRLLCRRRRMPRCARQRCPDARDPPHAPPPRRPVGHTGQTNTHVTVRRCTVRDHGGSADAVREHGPGDAGVVPRRLGCEVRTSTGDDGSRVAATIRTSAATADHQPESLSVSGSPRRAQRPLRARVSPRGGERRGQARWERTPGSAQGILRTDASASSVVQSTDTPSASS